MGEITVIQIKDALNQYFNETELRELCFELGEDYEAFGGSGKAGKTLEIAAWANRHGRIHELIALIKRERTHAFPHSPIPAAGSTANTTQQAQSGGVTYIISGGTFVGTNIGSGNLTANNIAGGNLTVNPATTVPEFKAQMTELHNLVAELVSQNVISEPRDQQHLASDLHDAVDELSQPKPDAHRLTSRLEDIKRVLDKTKITAEAASNAGVALAKASAIIAALYQTVQGLFPD